MKYIVYAMAAMFFLASCSKDNDETGGGNGGGGETGGVTDVTPVTSDLTVNLTTDKACYKPGETVSFTADALPEGAKVRYRTLNKVISEQTVAGSSWTWTAVTCQFPSHSERSRNGKTANMSIPTKTISSTISNRHGFVSRPI